jgi:hypothetical protein
LLFAAVTFAVVMSFIRELPGLGIMTDVGAPVLSGLVFWAMGLLELRRRRVLQSCIMAEQLELGRDLDGGGTATPQAGNL